MTQHQAMSSEQNAANFDSSPSYLQAKKGIWSWLYTIDHKRIALLYLSVIIISFLLGGIYALLLRLELWTPQADLFKDSNNYNKAFTTHGLVMIFAVLIPSVPAVLGNFLLPLQVGAKDLAFPKINLASFYVYLLGVSLALYAIFIKGIDTGWTFYTPYSNTSTTNVIPMLLAGFVIGFSSIMTGLNFIVTIHKLRAPGMTFFRMPLFCWAMYATSIIMILATPVLGITLLLVIAERVLHVGIFDPKMGGDPILFQHFFWFYSHPAVYIMIVPGFGVISELVSTFSRKPIFGYRAIALSSLSIAIIGFLIWGHHMYTSGQSALASVIFSFLTFLVALPTAVKIFNWVSTMYKGEIYLNTPMWYALGFFFLFMIGGLTGIFLATIQVDIHLHDTYFVVAHFHYVMVGGTLFAFFGGLHYWWPKITGKMFDEGTGTAGAIITFIGFNLTFLPQFILGTQGMPRRYHTYPKDLDLPNLYPFTLLHRISTVGAIVLAIGLFLAAYTLLGALFSKKKAPANPWQGTTLEWQTPSPPPVENFTYEPLITKGPYDRPEQ